MPPLPDAWYHMNGMRPPRKVTSRRGKLAVRLKDLDRVDPLIKANLLAGKLDLSQVIRVDRDDVDETGVVFVCDLLTACCICDILRQEDQKAGDTPTVVYAFRKRAWTRVPGGVSLSLVTDGTSRINLEVFPDERPGVNVGPLPPKKVRLGRRRYESE